MTQLCRACQTINRDAAKYCRGCAVKFSSAGAALASSPRPAFIAPAAAQRPSGINAAPRRVAGISIPQGLDVSVVWAGALMVLACAAFVLWYAGRASEPGAPAARSYAAAPAAPVVQLAPFAAAAPLPRADLPAPPPKAVPANDIPIESAAGGPAEAVEKFYRALSFGDGEAAAGFVTPEKRGSGPFNASKMTAFYRSFREPLAVRSVRQIDANLVEAKYSYRVSKTQCHGTAIVNTELVSDRMLIRNIRANC